MRRLMIIFVIGCSALGLGLGLMLNNSSPGSSKNSSASRSEEPSTTSTTVKVLGATATRTAQAPAVTTPTVVTIPSTTTTRPAATTTTRAAARAARPATTTTRKPAAAKKPAVDCGTGNTSAALKGEYDATDALWHITVTIDNQNSKAVVLDKLVVHVKYDDGTERDITMPNAAGTKIESGKQAAFSVTDSSGSAALTDLGVASHGFAYHTDGEPTACATS